jgi:hypothetical protein
MLTMTTIICWSIETWPADRRCSTRLFTRNKATPVPNMTVLVATSGQSCPVELFGRGSCQQNTNTFAARGEQAQFLQNGSILIFDRVSSANTTTKTEIAMGYVHTGLFGGGITGVHFIKKRARLVEVVAGRNFEFTKSNRRSCCFADSVTDIQYYLTEQLHIIAPTNRLLSRESLYRKEVV